MKSEANSATATEETANPMEQTAPSEADRCSPS
jgi:hypothetical protein